MYIKNIKFIIFICIILITLSSCGIYSFTGASYGTAKSVTIDFFPNRASFVNPRLSNYFTEQLKDKFVSQTPLTLTSQNGDLHYEGEITGYTIAPVSIVAGEKAAENRLTITIKVKFSNSTAPDNDFNKSYSRFANYPTTQVFTTVEEELVRQIIEQIIDDVFNDSVVNW